MIVVVLWVIVCICFHVRKKKKKLNLEPLEKKVAEVYKMTNAVKNFLKRKMFTHFDTRSKRGLKSTKFYICYAAR